MPVRQYNGCCAPKSINLLARRPKGFRAQRGAMRSGIPPVDNEVVRYVVAFRRSGTELGIGGPEVLRTRSGKSWRAAEIGDREAEPPVAGVQGAVDLAGRPLRNDVAHGSVSPKGKLSGFSVSEPRAGAHAPFGRGHRGELEGVGRGLRAFRGLIRTPTV
jgi:hypothetical protein